MKDSINLDSSIKNKQNLDLDELETLRQNLTSLKKIDTNDIQRIRKNIEELEKNASKLKIAELREESKKCQSIISDLKVEVSDLQKYINALN